MRVAKWYNICRRSRNGGLSGESAKNSNGRYSEHNGRSEKDFLLDLYSKDQEHNLYVQQRIQQWNRKAVHNVVGRQHDVRETGCLEPALEQKSNVVK